MSDKPPGVTLTITLHRLGASALAQLIKRTRSRKLGREDLDLVTPSEQNEAEIALEALRRALAEQGFDPQ